MKRSQQPRQETIHKYTIFLKSALVKMKKDGGNFSSTNFIRVNRLPSQFIQECVKLGFVDRVGEKRNTKYFPILDFGTVCEAHGRALAENILKYNNSHLSEGNKTTLCFENKFSTFLKEYKEESKLKSQNFVNFSDNELIDELKRRGYNGNLSKKVIKRIEF